MLQKQSQSIVPASEGRGPGQSAHGMTRCPAQQVFGMTLSSASSPSWPTSCLSRRYLLRIRGMDKKATDQYKNSRLMKSLWILQKSGSLCLCIISCECSPPKHGRNHSPVAVFSASHRSPMPASLHLTSPDLWQISGILQWKFFPIAAFSCLYCASHSCVRFHNFTFTHLQT